MSNIRGSTNRTTEPNLGVAWHDTQGLKTLSAGLKSTERIAISKINNQIVFTKYHESGLEGLLRKLTNLKAYVSNTSAKKITVLSTDLSKIQQQSPKIFELISHASPSHSGGNNSTVGAERFKRVVLNLQLSKLESPIASQIQVPTKTKINVPVFPHLQKPEIKENLATLTSNLSYETWLKLSITNPAKEEDAARHTKAFIDFLKHQIASETKTHDNADAMNFAKCWNEKTQYPLEIKIMQDFYGAEVFAAISLAAINLLSLKDS